MKKLLYLFLPLALLFASCSNDDDDDNDFKHPIVGTWQFTRIELLIDASPEELKRDITNMLNQMVEESMEQEEWTETGIFIFKGNKKADVSNGAVTVKDAFSYNILDNILTMKSLLPISSQTLTYKFEIDGKELALITDVTNEDEIQKLLQNYPSTGQITSVLIKEVMTRK